MKTAKKGFALLLALIMVLSLSGCGSLQALKAIRNLQKLESFRTDCSIDMSMGLGMFDHTIMDMDFCISGAADVNRDPLRGAGEFRADIMGEAKEGQLYFSREDDRLMLYASADGGETWKSNSIDLSGSSPDSGFSLSKETLAWITKTAATFEETGKEEVNGYDATVYAGCISGEELKAMLGESDTLEALAEAMEADPGELEPEIIGDIPITVALDNETGLPVRITVDLSGMMDSLFPFFLKAVTKAASESGEGTDEILSLLTMMDVSFNKFTITVLLSDFNEVGEVVIPEEVLDAAVETRTPAGAGG